MRRLDLSQLEWTLSGWSAHAWRLKQSMEINYQFRPHIGPIPAEVPGSVQAALLNADAIPDWNMGLNSYQSEWIERRHWEFSTTIPADWRDDAQSTVLVCQGPDNQGRIFLDGEEVGVFEGTFLPCRLDLTGRLTPRRAHELNIFIEGAPDEQPQFGYTSASRHFKPRFNYQWDWCPRIVTLGLWDAIYLEVGDAPRFLIVRPKAELLENLETGQLQVRGRVWSAQAGRMVLTARLKRHGRQLEEIRQTLECTAGEQSCDMPFPLLHVQPWQPNGMGEPTLYDLEVQITDEAGRLCDNWSTRVGFKRVQWLPCDDASPDALPWICEINGRKLFLQGVNWTPIRPNYQDLARADYAKRLEAYAQAGFNLLRVWGGGLIEKSDFYELCDELGLLVWQEFPLSSSAIDNTPPSDPQVIDKLTRIAQSAIERRGGHASLLLWCGGNELLSGATRDEPGAVWPWDESHPCLKALGDVVRRLDPGVRFLPTSASGPSFQAFADKFGQGIHHDVHGPWIMDSSFEQWCEYWDHDDALFRSELGLPSASPIDLLEAYHGECELWPPSQDNPYWRHPGDWWVEWDRFKDALPAEGGLAGVRKYIQLSQELQAKALAYAVWTCKRRFPACGGVIIWMGHDCFPCAVNTAILDFFGRPKPVVRELESILKTKPEALENFLEKKCDKVVPGGPPGHL